MTSASSDIGLIGLAVMGQNLALNIADHNFNISVLIGLTQKQKLSFEPNPNTPGALLGFEQLEDFVASLKRPRKSSFLFKQEERPMRLLMPLFHYSIKRILSSMVVMLNGMILFVEKRL